MSHENQAYTVSVLTPQNEYIKDLSDSPSAITQRQNPVFCPSQKPQMTTKNMNNKFNINVYDHLVNRSPSLPDRNVTQQQNNAKERTRGTNPIMIPVQSGVPYTSRREIDRLDSITLVKKSAAEDYDSNGYLTPADPPTYKDCCNTDSMSSHLGSETSTTYRGHERRYRFDSGLGDCESVRGSNSVQISTSPASSSNSVSSPRLSTQYEQHYEDIDHYSKSCVDQHPQSNRHVKRSSNGKCVVDNVRVQQLQSVNVSSVTHSDTEDSDPPITKSMAETILEPMHDPRIGSLPHTYMPLRTSFHKQESLKHDQPTKGGCWYITILSFILLISLTALSLSIYALVSVKTVSHTETLETNQAAVHSDITIDNLQNQINALMKENEALKEFLLAEQKNLTSYVEQEVMQLSYQKQNLNEDLRQMEHKFDDKITNISLQKQNLNEDLRQMEHKFDDKITKISLTPGPQGPPGVANFSLCVNRELGSSSVAHKTELTQTSYLPTEAEIKNFFVIFAYCSYSGATDAYLESLPNSSNNRYRYRCNCWGKVPEQSQTLCKINMWMCPHGN